MTQYKHIFALYLFVWLVLVLVPAAYVVLWNGTYEELIQAVNHFWSQIKPPAA